jgi:uncharacterized protein YqeY
MTIKDELAAELTTAMKSGDSRRRDAIRQVQTEIATARAEPGFDGAEDDAFYQRVISSYVKKMDKSRSEYEGYGERGAAMAEKLAFEVDFLSRWLPTKLGETETRQLVVSTIESLGVTGDPKSAGRVIGTLMKEHRDQLDGGLVNRIVSEELGAG